MCGIVGYVGTKNCVPILLSGLKRLEYRGYDSAGVAVIDIDKSKIDIVKTKGRLTILEEKLNQNPIEGFVGIGHTRWATHGEPSDENSHPHVSQSGKIAIVHNGIIENYLKLKEFLIKKGYTFSSDTDTEVVAHLIEYYYDGDILDAFIKTLEKIQGSYALGVLCLDRPDMILAARKDSPLIVGLGQGENFIASDIPAILEYTRNTYILEENEIAIVTKDKVEIVNTEKEPVKKEVFHVTWDVSSAEKGGYEHFMIKEIMEQPKAIRDTLTGRLPDSGFEVNLDGINITKEDLQKLNKIFIVACGTAYHAGIVGKHVIEKLTRIPVEVDIASEFRYRDPIVDENTLTIVISQSGETIDTLVAMREAKARGSRTLGIVNVVGSSIAREVDDCLYTWAGPEIAVASTKAYTTQLICLYLIALDFATKLGTISYEEFANIRDEIKRLAEKVEYVLTHKENIQKYASEHFNAKDIFYLGRGLDFAVAMEGSLKLKEISYIHSEAYAAGELKHGTIALIEDGTFVIALATQEKLFEKMVSNIKEVKSRGAVVLSVAQEGNTDIENVSDHVLYIPRTLDILAPVLTVVPLQLFAYYTAVQRGCDVDKPRNLAKSVTVE
ncbi:glutamine--fructose-6-phosphate transaminase (isomerizing) [Caldicellulosiruptor naganoensis]|uniref:Glutamine--fructose-6-phosphate aminotransferase [isomerizing] n=1 Tax=Caldicellulosiruptor naganoensis TaxID=29324 RepID=A0ABY7BKK1_9FIRM|nr:glutamine--fructose-6-phosphate transaminase (isomerizing) [Caldicellulosiruptor naganoensis]WAM31899.1 glutamine--fructose-6-phosphate transaminase (isomerizing) [Caldicellulosiruptor naganoensis]